MPVTFGVPLDGLIGSRPVTANAFDQTSSSTNDGILRIVGSLSPLLKPHVQHLFGQPECQCWDEDDENQRNNFQYNKCFCIWCLVGICLVACILVAFIVGFTLGHKSSKNNEGNVNCITFENKCIF